MKFVCDNCSTQYLISDDKIGPKGVKVRCKRCGNVIIVRPEDEDRAQTDPSGMAAETAEADNPFAQNQDGRDEVGQAFDQLLAGGLGPDDEEDEGEEQATEVFRMNELDSSNSRADSDLDKIDEVFANAESTELKKGAARDRSDWYVAIGDEQVGPMTLLELESRWSDGEIGSSTLAWFPGMSDWTAIGEIAELRYLLGRRAVGQRENTEVETPEEPQEAAPAVSTPPAENEWAPYKGSELASLVEEEIAAADSLPPPDDQVEEDGEQPFGGDLPDDDEEAPPWALDESASGEVAKPSENFFDSSLDKGTGGDDPEYLNGTYSRSGRVLSGPAYLGGAKRGSSKSKWILVGVLGGVILAGGAVTAVVVSSNGDPKPSDVEPIKPPDAGTVADAGTVTKGPSGPVDEKPGDPKPGDPPVDGNTGDAKPGTDSVGKEFVVAKPAVENPQTGVRVKDRTPSSKRKKRRRVTPSTVKKPDPKPDPKPIKSDPVVDSSLPKKLSKSQISKTMKKKISAMKQCVEQQRQRDPSVTGTMMVSFTIDPGGTVSTVRIKTAQHQGTFVAGCIQYIIKSMKFPKAQQPFTVPVLPLKLGG